MKFATLEISWNFIWSWPIQKMPDYFKEQETLARRNSIYTTWMLLYCLKTLQLAEMLLTKTWKRYAKSLEKKRWPITALGPQESISWKDLDMTIVTLSLPQVSTLVEIYLCLDDFFWDSSETQILVLIMIFIFRTQICSFYFQLQSKTYPWGICRKSICDGHS